MSEFQMVLGLQGSYVKFYGAGAATACLQDVDCSPTANPSMYPRYEVRVLHVPWVPQFLACSGQNLSFRSSHVLSSSYTVFL